MLKFKPRVLFPITALVILIFILSKQLFNLPPLGKFLDPFTGIVQNGNETTLNTSRVLHNKNGLKAPARIFFDERKVPHIYAQNEEDVYFAQGYVTASLRLWQMDFLSFVSAGRLSEIFDEPKYLQYDRVQRRLGLLAAAESSLQLIKSDRETFKNMDAYTKGVNAFINELDYKTMPLEYKLLDYKPEPWTNLKTVLILKQLGNTLSGYEEDVAMSRLMQILGEKKFNQLYPDFHSHITPVMDLPQRSKQNDSVTIKAPVYLDKSFLQLGSTLTESAYNPHLGSNSWAVSGKLTKSGAPMLACDPHLNLSLPCIWMETQLTCPGLNVYGVSVPGMPSVVIGFNEKIAWGITNGADDVKDWYKLKISNDNKQYEIDGRWINFTHRIEQIKRKDRPSVYDTISISIHGPVVYARNFSRPMPELVNYALKWELNNPSNEFRAFMQLGKAKNYREFREAIKYVKCPSLNFTFASSDDTIAVVHQGNLAAKIYGQGKFLLDGTTTSGGGYIPQDSLPALVNPVNQVVISANQHPTYPGYPYYYNGYYAETRANEIKKKLTKELTLETMKSMQMDNTNSFAVEALPVLINRIDESRLSDADKKTLWELRSWQGRYDADDKMADLFTMWWDNITNYTWDELTKYKFKLKKPDDFILLDLIEKDTSCEFFNKMETTERENAIDIVTAAFREAADTHRDMHSHGITCWGDINKVDIKHLTNLPAFSLLQLPSSGYPKAINAISRTWGPSWRMVVELGDHPRAYGIYPGGPSGNIASREYDRFVKDWNKGIYYSLNFFMSEKEARQLCKVNWWFK